jgi:hypothetical protein
MGDVSVYFSWGMKVFKVFGVVSQWSGKALEDGKVSGEELLELGKGICDILGVPAELPVPDEIVNANEGEASE